MTKFQIIYWRDIPVQVRIRKGRTRHTRPLSPRFQQAVFRAAFRAKAITGDAYAQAWRLGDWYERPGDLEEVEGAVIAGIEADFSNEMLDNIARNKGFKVA